ncbi:transglutaminase domain-containing protein [Chloroflexota bacterium]
MKTVTVVSCLVLALVAVTLTCGYVLATPSTGFNEKDGDAFDDWGICRTRAFGDDGFYQLTESGFRPVIAFESLGEHAALAYSLGQQIADEYPDQFQRAEAVFHFVRDRVNYASDIDRFQHEEFAQNADELATAINEKGRGYGDCEDSTVLLAVMYKGAGYRSAIVVGEGHTATLVYLPDYKKATAVFTLKGEPGWVWAEATGKNNPLGWVPKEYIDVRLAVYEVTKEDINWTAPPPAPAVAETGKSSSSPSFLFFGVIGLLWLLPLFRRRRRY